MICLGNTINYLLRERVTPVIVNIGEWSEGDEEDTQRELDKIKENYPNRTIIVDDVPLED